MQCSIHTYCAQYCVDPQSSGPLPLLGHHDPQQLVLQAFGGDHEVEQGHLGGQLWQVVGVPQLGGDVEAEAVGILDHALSQSDAVHATWTERGTNTNSAPVRRAD